MNRFLYKDLFQYYGKKKHKDKTPTQPNPKPLTQVFFKTVKKRETC